MFENKVAYLRYLELREPKLPENGGSYIILNYIILYSSPNINRNLKSRRLRWTGHVARMEETRKASVLVGRPEGRRTLGRRRRRLDNNITMDRDRSVVSRIPTSWDWTHTGIWSCKLQGMNFYIWGGYIEEEEAEEETEG